MSRYLVLAASLIVAAVCIRLGFWQLDRLAQKRAFNAETLARLTKPVVGVDAADSDSLGAGYRRVVAEGRFDYTREIVLNARSHQGSPGVHIVTPLVRAGSDTLILVLRGWVYAPDARTVDLTRWREADSARVEGYTLAFPTDSALLDSAVAAARDTSRAMRRLDRGRLEWRLGAPLPGYYIVMTAPDSNPQATPVRLIEPALGEGSHLSYAGQWFLFAMIFGAGGTVVVLRGRRSTSQKGSS